VPFFVCAIGIAYFDFKTVIVAYFYEFIRKKVKLFYLNAYEKENHISLMEEVSKLKSNWIMTYDNTIFIKNLYKNFNQIEFDLSYSARNKRIEKEIFDFSNYEEIEKNAFENTGLIQECIPKNIREIKSAAFANCQNLESVTIDADITALPDSAFMNCTSLLTVSGGNKITTIGMMLLQIA
jgi:hypothetical protein